MKKKQSYWRINFFHHFSKTDLTNIQKFTYPQTLSYRLIITREKVLVAIRWSRIDKTSGLEDISNSIFQAWSNKLFEILTILFQAYIEYVYHFFASRTALTLALSINKSFIISKSYCLIALLNTLSKTLELIMAKKITYFAEKYKILQNIQMGKQSSRSTKSVFKLLTEQVHTIWDQKGNKIATLMSINTINVFDIVVSHQHFIYDLQK